MVRDMPEPRPQRSDRRNRTLWASLYAVFIIWASLSHHGTWRSLPDPLFAFLYAPLPAWVTRTDLATNLLVYVPLGYLVRVAVSVPRFPWTSVLLSTLSIAVLSLAMETLQQALPDRNASNLDLIINTLGGLSGAIVSLHHGRWRRVLHYLHEVRARWLTPGVATNFGVVLIIVWVVAQFSLRPLPGVGWLQLYLRPIDSQQSSLYDINAVWFAAQALELLALGAFVSTLMRPGRYTAALTLLFGMAFLTKLLAASILLKLPVVAGLLSLETLAAFFVAFWILLAPTASRHRRGLAIASLLGCIAWRLAEGVALFWPKASLLNLVGLGATLAAWWPWAALIVLAMPSLSRHSTRRN